MTLDQAMVSWILYQTKVKINQTIKIKNFYTSKDTINRMKREFMEWEKLFINPISDRVNIQIFNSYNSATEKQIS